MTKLGLSALLTAWLLFAPTSSLLAQSPTAQLVVGGGWVTNYHKSDSAYPATTNPLVDSNLTKTAPEVQGFLTTLTNTGLAQLGTVYGDSGDALAPNGELIERVFRSSTIANPFIETYCPFTSDPQFGFICNDTYQTGTAETTVDSNDIFYYSGHGGTHSGPSNVCGVGLSCAVIELANEKDRWRALSTEMRLGQNRLKWLILSGCDTLPTDNMQWASNWIGAFAGLHEILGFRTSADEGNSNLNILGNIFATEISSGTAVAPAWMDAAGMFAGGDGVGGILSPGAVNYPAIITAESAINTLGTYDGDSITTPVASIPQPTVFRYAYLAPSLFSTYIPPPIFANSTDVTLDQLSLNQSFIGFLEPSGSGPSSQEISLGNTTTPIAETVEFKDTNVSWLGKDYDHTTPGYLAVSADATSLTPGTYNATLSVVPTITQTAPVDINTRLVAASINQAYFTHDPFPANCRPLPSNDPPSTDGNPINDAYVEVSKSGLLAAAGYIVDPDNSVYLLGKLNLPATTSPQFQCIQWGLNSTKPAAIFLVTSLGFGSLS